MPVLNFRSLQRISNDHKLVKEDVQMSEEFKTKWQQFGKVWETGQLEVMDDIFAPNVNYHLPPFPDMNLEFLKGFIAGFCKSFPDFQLKTEEEIIQARIDNVAGLAS